MRCPHCGEPVKPGQERCFACGEKIRARGLRHESTVDYRIFIVGGLLALLGVVGALVIIFGARQQHTRSTPKRPRVQLEKTVRPVKRVDSVATIAGRKGEIQRARGKLEKIYARFEKVKSQVIGETPTPEQRELMTQIQREMSVMNAKIMEMSGSITLEKKKQLQRELSDAERKINNLLSQFSRAPKSR